MKTWTIWAPPLALFSLVSLLLLFCPGVQDWPRSPFFQSLPYILLAVAILLGIAFSQGRVVFISVILVAVVFAVGRAFSTDIRQRGAPVVLLAAIYVPMLSAILRHLHEAGVFTPKGFGRGVLVLSSAFMVILLPEIDFFRTGISGSDMSFLNPHPGILRIPGIGLLAFCSCIPVLLLRREHENQRIGPAMAFCMLFVMAALNFRASLWTGLQAWSSFIVFASGSALVLIWHVLENSWHEAFMDELTELPGRRSMKHHFSRLDHTYSIAVLDIDHFKSINDKYGHNTGDQVLRFIASHLKDNTVGKPYRYGGEEFVIIAESGSFEQVVAGLEELRRKIAGRKFVLRSKHRPRKKPSRPAPGRSGEQQEGITVTVSIGAAECSDQWPLPSDVFGAADKALYRAKEDGRNCVKIAH